MAKKEAPKKTKVKSEDVVKKSDSPVVMNDMLAELEKVVKIQSISIGQEHRMSTGLLCLDIVLGGGITSGMYTFAGPEQSAKTTTAVTILASSTKQDVGLRVLWDAENSSGSSMDYVTNIFRTQGVKMNSETLFGTKVNNKYVQTPMVYYRDEGEMDTYFDWVAALLRRLPDKRFDAGQWWYVYDDTKENKAKYKDQMNKKMSAANGGVYIPAESGALQALILVDSYPSLMPASMDEDDVKVGMALVAREFSKHLPRIKGKLRSKRVAILGINQIREKIGFVMGDPRYEPAGSALKFLCFTGDTLLTTDKGLLTGEEYYQSFKSSLPKIVGQKGKEKPTVFDFMGMSQTVKINTSLGYRMSGKPGHRVLALKNNSLTPQFVSLEEIAKYPLVWSVAVKHSARVFPKFNPKLDFKPVGIADTQDGNQADANLVLPSQITPEIAYALGAMVGDGYVRNGGVSLISENLDVVKKVAKIFRDQFGIKIKDNRVVRKYRGLYLFGFSSKKLGQWLSYIGLGNKSSHTKSVPWVIRQGTEDIQAAFLAGNFDTDYFHTVNETLAVQLQVMLLNFGVVTSSMRGKDGFWNHGLHSGNEPWEARKHWGSVKGIHDRKDKYATHSSTFKPQVYPPYTNTLYDLVSPYSVRSLRLEKLRSVSPDYSDIDKNWKESMVIGRLPTTEKVWNKSFEAFKLFQMSESISKKLYTDTRYKDILPQLREIANQARTVQERNKANLSLDKYVKLCETSVRDSLVWSQVIGASSFEERQMTYDANMPKSSTIVTNGIVSHNSDVRIWNTPRALSGVPFNPKGKGQYENEKSVTGEGEDVYRYIHIKAIKNKLSVPNRESWLRIWVSDADQNAQGFDPVWDTFYALYLTGQVSGKRSSMTLEISGLGKAKKPLSWDEFKQMIIGTPEQIAKICAKCGYKTMNLRKGLFNMIKKGKMEELYAANSKALISGTKKVEKDDEDEDDDE